MPLRLIEVFLPEANKPHVLEALNEQEVMGIWHEHLDDQQIMCKVLVHTEEVEDVIDTLEKFSNQDGYRLVLLPVEASLPRPPSEQPDPLPNDFLKQTYSGKSARKAKRLRISREELYTDISGSVKVSTTFIAMVTLSAIVASIGLLKDNVAVIIGAMVIAPLLGPNVALALATTLADFELGKRALLANFYGISISFVIALVVGFIFSNLPDTDITAIPEILARTRVDMGDILLALVSGIAGALAMTMGVSTTLVGVMVAVALLPPLATFAMLLGAGEIQLAMNALMLLATNIISVNLAGVTTFVFQGVRPATFFEAGRAQKASWVAMLIWASLLTGLIFIVSFSQQS